MLSNGSWGGISVALTPETLASFTGQISGSSDWTTAAVWNSSYYKVFKDHGIESPTINFSGYTNITVKVKMRTYGGSGATTSVLHIKQNDTELTTLTATSNSLKYYSASINVSGSASLSFTCEASTDTKCLGVSEIEISGVLDLPSSGISLSTNAGSITVGGELDISKYVSTATGYSGKVTYSLKSGEGIASVSEEGVISGLSAGEAVITVTAPAVEGLYAKSEADFTITINDSRNTTNTSFGNNVDNKTKVVFVGQENSFISPTATITPSELLSSLSYSSNNTSVAKVDEKTGVVTFIKPGNVTITSSFAGNETYAQSSASYDLYYINEKIEFNNSHSSFPGGQTQYQAKGNGEEQKFVMKDNNNITYDFIGHYYYCPGGKLQLYKNEGYVKSPSFDFEFGYRLIVTCETNTINISIGEQTVTGSENTIEISTDKPNQSFKIFTGT